MGNTLTLTLIITGFLCVLNILCIYIFRQRRVAEKLSYFTAVLVELTLFAFALALRLGILVSIPYHLPPHLPFNRAEIAAAIALAIGLFPVAYWHHTSVSQLRVRIAEDARTLKKRDAGVHVNGDTPGEWMN